jgi:hypothetical protein
MKRFTSLLLIAMASTNTFALEITKGELLEHKEWTTGNVTGIFKNLDSKTSKEARKFQAANDQRPISPRQSIVTNGTMFSAESFVDKNTIIYGVRDLSFYNGTDSPQTYIIETRLCSSLFPIETQEPFNGFNCAVSQDKLQLDADGSIDLKKYAELLRNYSEIGSYDTYISTIVYNENKSISFSSSASSTLVIIKGQDDDISRN